jgi:hypothetical protein
MRRHANVRAVGLRPRNLCFPDAERAGCHRRQQQPLREGVFWARRGLVSGGVFDHSTHEEDGPGTWEALAFPRRNSGVAESRCVVSGARRVGGCPCRRPTWASNKRPPRGRSLARGTGAAAEGGRESEGCIGALTSGNGVALGPDRAQAARGGVNFRREPCPTLRRWRPCHQDF